MNNIIHILSSGWINQILYGTLITFFLSLIGYTVAVIIGLTFTALLVFEVKFTRSVANIYTVLFRGLPELLVIFFVYYLLSDLVKYISDLYGFRVNSTAISFIAAVIALGLISGCYLTEVFRGAYAAIPYGQIEAGLALGMNKFILFFRIILPQLFDYGFRGLINIWLVILKDSALVMVIGVVELMFKSNLAVTTTNMPFLFYGIAGLIYLALSVISSIVLNRLDPKRKYYKVGL